MVMNFARQARGGCHGDSADFLHAFVSPEYFKRLKVSWSPEFSQIHSTRI